MNWFYLLIHKIGDRLVVNYGLESARLLKLILIRSCLLLYLVLWLFLVCFIEHWLFGALNERVVLDGLLHVEIYIPGTHHSVVFFIVQLLISFLTLNIYALLVQLLHLLCQTLKSRTSLFDDLRHWKPVQSRLAAVTAHRQPELGNTEFGFFELHNGIDKVDLVIKLNSRLVVNHRLFVLDRNKIVQYCVFGVVSFLKCNWLRLVHVL